MMWKLGNVIFVLIVLMILLDFSVASMGRDYRALSQLTKQKGKLKMAARPNSKAQLVTYYQNLALADATAPTAKPCIYVYRTHVGAVRNLYVGKALNCQTRIGQHNTDMRQAIYMAAATNFAKNAGPLTGLHATYNLIQTIAGAHEAHDNCIIREAMNDNTNFELEVLYVDPLYVGPAFAKGDARLTQTEAREINVLNPVCNVQRPADPGARHAAFAASVYQNINVNDALRIPGEIYYYSLNWANSVTHTVVGGAEVNDPSNGWVGI